MHPTPTTSTPVPRSASIGGIAFAVLFVTALALDHLPRGDAPLNSVSTFYASHAHRLETLAGGYALVFAALAFLWFLGGVRTMWRTAGVSEAASSAAYGAGILFAGLLTAGAACFLAPAAFATFGSEKLTSLDALRVIPDLRHPLVLVCGMLCAAVFTFSTSVIALRSPSPTSRAVAWFGIPVSVFMLIGGFFFPLVAFLLWVVATSISLARRGAALTKEMPGSSPVASH